jgi:hypothetical protein
MSEQKPNQITFEYKISPGFHVYAVSGGYGGISPQGEIVLNLYHERPSIPKTQTFDIMADGSLGQIPSSEERKSALIRDVMFGIALNPVTARSLAAWLKEKADIYENEIMARGISVNIH